MLLGGIITIPFWGYLTTPLALMEVMLSDLPHVMYHPPVATKAEEVNRALIARDMRRKVQKGGLRGVKGLNLNFGKPAGDGSAEIMSLKRR